MKSVFYAASIVLITLSGCATTPGKILDTESLFRNVNESNTYFDTAYGYALFPTIGKAGVGIGVGHGSGNIFSQSGVIGEASMTQLSAGLQLGGSTFSQVIFFEDERALSDFCEGNYEFSASTSAIALTTAASAAATTTGTNSSLSNNKADAKSSARYHKGIAVFTIAKGGLMAEVSLTGQKFRTRC